MINDFFQDVANTKPYFKAALEGFAGSGKTFTMAQIAIGLHRRIGSKKPIAIYDSETASKFLRPNFAAAGIQAVVKESRSFLDLKEAMRLCREGFADILLIDSITHPYKDLIDSYLSAKNRQTMEIQDWGIIKPRWQKEIAETMVRDPYHVIFTGRAAYEYETDIDKRTGKKTMFKAGIKMRGEAETAYEPDILILMERCEDLLEGEKTVWREGTILKDRANLIDGKTFKNPSYKEFEPVIAALLDQPVMRQQSEANTAASFARDSDGEDWRQRKAILLETIQGILIEAGLDGRGDAAKALKLQVLSAAFGTYSKTAIEAMRVEQLEKGIAALKEQVAAMVPKSDTNGGA